LCAIGLTEVAEVMRPMPVRPLAGIPAFVCGVAVIRAEPTPVVSVPALIAGTAHRGRAGRFVTARQRGRTVALAVDEVIGVRTLPAETLSETIPLLGSLGAEVLAGLSALGSDPLLVLAGARLVPEAVWAALEVDRPPVEPGGVS
jgi:purine-binding chemotaxis protein CheW